ncbi:flagellar biosynthetic protein FlhB [Thiohalospira halophila DSM 15071]|uniref:Flagellar biosynthetic protein FlhB n=1 Tax=Thiohalospira halophila DSM 15071 TaxID=1123397 RepID=A0A1I1PNR6_9GAMM|nr:flagellar biosynthesis protein FlhB [Thiohalospira halophila]SFD08623.1 flagellar biosynthetic protein FlhB [Thiohalospira halophila DSM 15071]
MAENEEGQEKTEEPTPKRMQDARDKGQVPRSRELTTMAMVMAAAGGFYFFGPMMIDGLLNILEANFAQEREAVFDEGILIERLFASALQGLWVITPFLIVMVIIAIVSSIALSGWVISLEAMAFKWSKLDPVKGLGRVFGPRGGLEFLKAFFKFSLVGALAILFLWMEGRDFLALGTASLEVAMAQMGELLLYAFFFMSLSLILLAVVDIPFQLWDNQRQLKMTRKEVQDENKQTEGDPQVKQRIRSLQQEMAQKRMMEEVPSADVVVTNPTHFAVALRYDQESMAAPVVVAKGVDLMANQIRSVASDNEVPILEAPPLARALYAHAELDQAIPAGLFQAVAQILAYLYFLREEGQSGPERFDDLPIPEELADAP